MAVAKESNIPAENLDLYEKLVATNPKVERKGASVPYTSLNGHMFSYLNSSGLMALKLPKDEIEKFLQKYKTTLFESYGIIQKEFVTVPDSLLRNTRELKVWFEKSYEYISRLKPKAKKKKS
jgi:hypothetical protein